MSESDVILIVDDHPVVLDNLSMTLETEGYQVLQAPDGLAALKALESQPVDLVLADIAMPGMNGYQLLERVREKPEWLLIPFVFLTARALDSDVRYGREMGVDDYLTKPIDPEDLLAVVRGRLRRAAQLRSLATAPPARPVSTGPRLAVGLLRLDCDQHRVWLGDETIELSAREFIVLRHLAAHQERVVSPQEIIEITHGFEADHVEAGILLRPLIRSLRRKLGYQVGETGCIETVRGVGYRLVPP
jgi:DNA-binding response OmpR family regulator